VHGIDDNLFDHIEVQMVGEFTVAGGMLLDKVLASGGSAEKTIVFTKTMMLLISPATECCSTLTDVIVCRDRVTHLWPEMLSSWLYPGLISNRVCRNGYGNAMQSRPFYGQQVCHKPQS